MRRVSLDCGGLSPAQLHDALALALDFPTWYGRNLDALYDCLTQLREDTVIELRSLAHEGFRQTILDAAAADPHLYVTLE